MMYGEESFGDLGRIRDGSPRFYKMLEEMAEIHDKKSHDYASNKDPSGNYHFAGQMAAMFMYSPEDAGFFGRIAEKIYRLANLESSDKRAKNESIEDTERDIAVITVLWMADRRERRAKLNAVGIQGMQASPEVEKIGAYKTIDPNPLQHELYDLIKLMPDFQTDDLMKFILDMRQVRRGGKAVI